MCTYYIHTCYRHGDPTQCFASSVVEGSVVFGSVGVASFDFASFALQALLLQSLPLQALLCKCCFCKLCFCKLCLCKVCYCKPCYCKRCCKHFARNTLVFLRCCKLFSNKVVFLRSCKCFGATAWVVHLICKHVAQTHVFSVLLVFLFEQACSTCVCPQGLLSLLHKNIGFPLLVYVVVSQTMVFHACVCLLALGSQLGSL